MIPASTSAAALARSFTPETADFRVYTYSREVQVVVAGAETWRIELQRPTSTTQLAVGRYPAVAQPDRGPDDAGLDLSAEGRGCEADDVSGWFELDDVAYAQAWSPWLAARSSTPAPPTTVLVVAPSAARCAGTAPSLPPTTSPRRRSPRLSDLPGRGPAGRRRRHVVHRLLAPGPASGRRGHRPRRVVQRTTSESGMIIEAWAPFPVETITLTVKMSSDAVVPSAGPRPRALPGRLSIRENPVLGGFSLNPGGGGTCADGMGGAELALDEVDPSEDGYDDLTVRWLVTCPGVGVTEQGEVRWQRPVPAGAPATPRAVTAAAGEDTTVVLWTPPVSGPTPTGYVVTTFVDGLAVDTPTTAPAGATSVVVPTPDDGSPHVQGRRGRRGRHRPALDGLGARRGARPGPRAVHLDLRLRPPAAPRPRRPAADRRGGLPTMGHSLARGEVTPQEVVRACAAGPGCRLVGPRPSRLTAAAFGWIPEHRPGPPTGSSGSRGRTVDTGDAVWPSRSSPPPSASAVRLAVGRRVRRPGVPERPRAGARWLPGRSLLGRPAGAGLVAWLGAGVVLRVGRDVARTATRSRSSPPTWPCWTGPDGRACNGARLGPP